MTKMSRAVGVSVEQLQSLRHAASLGGLEATQLDKAVQKLAINIADMSRGVGLAKDVFEKHNISVKNADGSLRTVMEVMADVADVTAGMTNATEKADLAYKLFGARGAKMINMLNGGSDAMHEAMLEAEKLGLVMSEETVNGVEDANDAITRLSSFLKSTFHQVVAKLAPAIQLITDNIREWIEMKVDEHGGIGEIAQLFALNLIEAGKSILKTFKVVYDGIAKFIFDIKALVKRERTLAAVNREIETFLDLKNKIETKGKWDFGEGLYDLIHLFQEGTPLETVNSLLDALYKEKEALKDFKEEIPTLEIEAWLIAMKSIEAEIRGVYVTNGLLNDSLKETANVLADQPTIWDKMKDGFAAYKESVEKGTKSIADVTMDVFKSVEDTIVNMVMGIKTDFKALVKSILADLVRIQVRKNIVIPLAGMLGFADGGRPPVGRPSIVGERGAELFVPDSAGTIIPNNQLGGGTINVTYSPNINALDPRTAASVIAENAPQIVGVVRQAFNRNGQAVAL